MHSDETRIYTALLIVACILAVILTFFVISLIRQHQKNLQLNKEKIQAEIITLESERMRIANDLHDDIGPVLSAVKLQINSLNTKSSEDSFIIKNAGKYIDDILSKIREITYGLMPSALLRKGILTAISEFLDTINQTHGIRISYSLCIEEGLLSQEKEVHLYRIVQEIIHNSIRHSLASEILVTIKKIKGLLIVDIYDNGKGFDFVSVIKNNGGIGIRSILSRVELLEGNVYLDTREGKGVEYIIEIPIS